MPSISFHNADKVFNFKNKKQLKLSIKALFEKEGKVLSSLNYIFCSDEYLLQINKDFLQHDYYTDIITFPLSEKGMPIEAELYISLDRIKDNAKANTTSTREETLRVIFHGALHLCGYKDKHRKDIATMRAKEAEYIKSSLPNH